MKAFAPSAGSAMWRAKSLRCSTIDRLGGQWGEAPRDTAYYAPILDHCWENFGEERVVYGSNWPVCEKGGSYANQFQIVREYFAAKGPAASERYFWKNAREVYRWPDRA